MIIQWEAQVSVSSFILVGVGRLDCNNSAVYSLHGRMSAATFITNVYLPHGLIEMVFTFFVF